MENDHFMLEVTQHGQPIDDFIQVIEQVTDDNDQTPATDTFRQCRQDLTKIGIWLGLAFSKRYQQTPKLRGCALGGTY